jgi:hypothetical protein
MIVDDRLVTHEQARVDLGKLPKEIGDKRQNIQPAELQREDSPASMRAGRRFIDDPARPKVQYIRLT